MPTTKKRSDLFEILAASGSGAPSTMDKVLAVAEARHRHPEITPQIDTFLIDQHAKCRAQVEKTKAHMKELEGVVEQLIAPPHIVVTYLGPSQMPDGRTAAVVAHNNARRVIPMTKSVDPAELRVGDEVLLNQDLSLLVARSPLDGLAFGETVCFERMLSEDRMLVRFQGEQIAIGIGADLLGEAWEPGDLVRWDRSARLALEKIEPTTSSEYMVEDVPDVRPEQVGGQRLVLDELISTLTIVLTNPKLAVRYGLSGQQVVLLVGPPGTGKTLMAKVAAAEIARLTGEACRILVVKPGQFEDPYVGVTQRRIRECFEVARGCDGYALIFLDEIESIGRQRGGLIGQHHDKFLAALLAELQGFSSDDGSKIAVIAATNRLDLLDAALVERLEVQLHVKRPDRRGAREIFAIHLGEELPYNPDGELAAATRNDLIERAVSRFYDPNADNDVCTVRFRDSKQRIITAPELASGRCFEQVCRAARRAACVREVCGGEPGISLNDIEEAVSLTLEKMGSTLTVHNVRNYLPDLPQDQDVVAVEPVVRRVAQPHRYFHTP